MNSFVRTDPVISDEEWDTRPSETELDRMIADCKRAVGPPIDRQDTDDRRLAMFLGVIRDCEAKAASGEDAYTLSRAQ